MRAHRHVTFFCVRLRMNAISSRTEKPSCPTGVPCMASGQIESVRKSLLHGAMTAAKTSERSKPVVQQALYGLFFLSGFAALIYQIVWQRVLFAAFGVNIESVTITVSLFMFGLGVGSLVGGVLS